MKNLAGVLEKMRNVTASAPQKGDVKEWKGQGKKVIGWLCTYVPEEIIYAAGMLPYRITGDSMDIETSGAYLYSNACSFARSCLELALRGQYDFLDGVVGCNTCDHIRRLYDVWEIYLEPPFIHILSVPHKVTEDSIRYYQGQLERFRKALEEFANIRISDDSLRHAIELYNKSRSLLKHIYDLRKGDSPPILGEEVLEIVKASMRMPRERYNEELERLLTTLKQSGRSFKDRVRILICGSILDKPEFIRVIEDAGGLVVTDELCTGSRYFDDVVDSSLPPLEGLARYYLSRAPCARMRPAQNRFDYVMDLVKEFKVQGVIYEVIKFCDNYGYDKPFLKQILSQEEISMLELDIEYLPGAVGQVKTRIEAFIEMLSNTGR